MTVNQAETYNLGDQATVKYAYANSKLTMTFTASQMGQTRESNLDCICDQSESFRFVREVPGVIIKYVKTKIISIYNYQAK